MKGGNKSTKKNLDYQEKGAGRKRLKQQACELMVVTSCRLHRPVSLKMQTNQSGDKVKTREEDMQTQGFSFLFNILL